MALVTRMSKSGLVLCETAGGEAEFGRALKQIDDRLVLQKHPGNVEGGWVYKVFVLVSDDLPPECIYTWSDEYGKPLPLSSGLIEEVRKLRRDVREQHGLIDADEHNRRHVERIREDAREHNTQIIEDHRARIERSQTMVSFSDVGKPGLGKGRVRPKSGIQR